jgi:serine/threonine protein kinase
MPKYARFLMPSLTAKEARELVPGYRVLAPVGRGGMAQVFLAERESDGLQLALKVLDARLAHDPTLRQRFEQEYRLIATIDSEFVARVYDYGFTGEHPYIAMEFLPGGTLAARIHEGIASLDALRIVSQVARALDAIHARGIVHRDLKPGNILFCSDGRPAIVDFGLAKDLGRSTALTQAGGVMATPRYMSPEQCLGNAVDARSDLYSLGVIFYEMLTGKRMFEDRNTAAVVAAHVHAEPPRLPQHLAGYQSVLDKLLAKKPEQRFQSARELFATIAV